jgi:hypothetical protein
MRLSYKKYPILKMLENRALDRVPLYEIDAVFLPFALGRYHRIWKQNAKFFTEKVVFLSKPFVSASSLAYEKLWDLYSDICHNDSGSLQINGTFVYEDLVYMINHRLIQGRDLWETVLYVFTSEGTPLMCWIEGQKNPEEDNLAWISNSYLHLVDCNSRESIIHFLSKRFASVIISAMFMKYASVEIVEIKAGKKAGSKKSKILNEMGIDALYLDSKWFTTLVRSEGFKVSGHFRLQPKKVNGYWTKELIWIDEFQKHGYTSHARKTISR